MIAIAAAVPLRGVTDARPEMARGVAVEDCTAGAANSRVMQKLDDHDLDVIVQVRKFGERFDHPFLECCP